MKSRWMAAAALLPLALTFLGCSEAEGGDDVGPCDPACSADACQICDTAGAEPVCVSACGDGLTCEAGQCLAPEVSLCEEGCGPCQVCDTSGDAPVCADVCGDGLTCEDGRCVAPEVSTCEPTCGPCQECDTTGAEPACVDLCGGGTVCVAGRCEFPGAEGFHDTVGVLGPFETGSSVTAACLHCHQSEADDFMQTAHWNWAGPTPGLQDADPTTAEAAVGKRNLINNFCIAIDANEPRCTQCHAGYGWTGPDFIETATAEQVDCLVCHADPEAGYAKDPKLAGAPAAGVDLVAAARSVGRPQVGNCGACHFHAGGGDNVKKGDLGTALLTATPDVDVHMGSGMQCVDCHAAEGHRIPGQGVHMPVAEGRVGCTDCHDAAPHANANLDNHALDVACETCHIPAFSRQQPTKMAWDWSTAGDRTIGTDGVIKAEVGGRTVSTYDWMKGDFVWEANVRPAYAWHDGRAMHLTKSDAFPVDEGSPENPVVISAPLASRDDAAAKIHPFKVMVGRQAADVAGRFLIVPDLFGPGSFWASVPSGADRSVDADPAFWNAVMTAGARAAGQVSSDYTYTSADWQFVNTVMWMGIEHEVAPASAALGCTDCHGNEAFDFTALGYTCDPMEGDCGSRH